MSKKLKEDYHKLNGLTAKIVEETIKGNIEIKESEKLQKIVRQRRRFLFLEHKLKWINWVMLFSWATIMGFIGWEVSGYNLDTMPSMVINGLAGIIPATFIAEGIGIYRAMKVTVKPEDIYDMIEKQKGA